MKRILFTVLLTVLALSLVFAGGANEEPEKPQVVVMGNARMYEGEEAAWEKVAADFEAETGIEVVLRWQGKWNEVPQNLSTASLAGEKVDLVTVGAGLINSIVARTGFLMDITDLMEPYRDRFGEGMLDSYTIGGRLWGFPYGNSAAGFTYYNKDIFNNLGIEPPTTYEELVEISKTISDAGYIPMIFRGKDETYWSNLFFYAFAQTTMNQPIEKTNDFLTGKRSFSSPEEIEAVNAVVSFFEDGILTSDSLDTNGDGMKAAFLQQKAAMMHTHNFQLLQTDCPDFELGIFEFPIIVEGAYSQPFGGPGTGIAIPSFADRDNLDNTMKFVEFLLRPENADLIIGCYKPVVEVVKGINLVDDPNVQYLNEVMIPKTVPYLDWIWPTEVNAAVCQIIPAVIAGTMTAEEGTEAVQAALERIQRETGYQYDWWNSWTESDWERVTP